MLFILGIERSATTWIANLLEAHPATQVYVEPMSVLTARFRDWPERYEQITDLESGAEYFKSEFELVKEHKKWLLTKASSQAFAWKFDLWLSNWLVRKQLASEAARDFSEINFHRKSQPSLPKNDKIELNIIKELRLNFNVDIIPVIDPNASVVVVVRNLFANIQSILKHIEQDNLAELKSLLIKKYRKIDAPTVYKYWRDSYNSLLQTLDKIQTPHLILSHSRLIQEPTEEIKNICKLAGLSDSKAILNYLQDSNKKGAGIHNTNRSHTDLLARNRRAQEKILPKIKVVFDKSELHPKLQKIVREETSA